MRNIYDTNVIELALSRRTGVQQACVVSYKTVSGPKILVAYIVADGDKENITDIQIAIERQLPSYIIPSYFIWIDEFPVDTTGKIIVNALPKPDLQELATFNSPRESKTVVNLFREQMEKTPDSVAVVYEEESITYRELDEKSNQLANYLTKRGVKAETLVPICINRSLEMIIGILGIMKAGGAYVPIDPEYPKDRIDYMLQDINANVLITDVQSIMLLQEQQETLEMICVDNDWDAISAEPKVAVQTSLKNHNLAYVIYTSGSTGKPKGVLIEHKSITNYIINSIHAYSSTNEQNAGSYVHLPLSFDASLTAIFVPLSIGKRIIINSLSQFEAFSDSNLLKHESFDFLKVTPSQLHLIDNAEESVRWISKRYVVGGEALQKRHYEFLIGGRVDAEIINEYGPTEATVGCVSYRFNVLNDNIPIYPFGVLIGKPMPNVSIYVLDEFSNPVPTGIEGEIYIGGVQVARGYHNRQELTKEKFLPDPFSDVSGAKMYKSGDLARYLPDGNLEYLGRIDEQIKVRGYRIELGEIENTIQQYPGIKHCIVAAKEDPSGDKRLIGYVVVEGQFNKSAIINYLQLKLPDYMVPQLLMELKEIPITSNGKVDRKALPNPDASELLTGQRIAPDSTVKKNLVNLWKEVLNVNQVGIYDNFFELGGNSLLASKIVARLVKQYKYSVSITKLYQFPTVSELSGYLEGKENTFKHPKQNLRKGGNSDVAVIGMAGRFPGANTIDELWEVLKQGKETTSFFTDKELDPSIPHHLRTDPTYVKARGVLDHADQFDAAFFGLTPKLAELTDPQQRIFLEIAWEVLEQTGYLPQRYKGTIGVYAGCGTNTYYSHNVLPNQQLIDQVGSMQVSSVNEKDYIASRTAYQLNLKGPAVSVHSACSTSLLAIAQAVDAIRNGRCDLALAGGASVTSPINSGHIYQEGSMLSSDGHCRSFDVDGQGTVFSDGAGVVLLKSLEAAERDGDLVYAVIKGTGVNNDGGGKGSFTAPSAEGQAGAIRMALDDAQIDAASVSYVEAHGTATPIGDPIEIEGLKMAFGNQSSAQFCAIGSIKSNMGHLTAAAGVAGLIKTTLALHHRQIPASLGFSTPNPNIDFTNSPFYVNTALTDWPSTAVGPEKPRRAGVSSFGVGGTNVHVILEEHTHQVPVPASDKPASRRPVELITWSAKSTASRDAYGQLLAKHLQHNNQLQLADVAFTLQTTRVDFGHRRLIMAATGDELAETLLTDSVPPSGIKTAKEAPKEVVFLFPGQGSQYLNMGRELYENEPVYRQAIDACAELLEPHLGADIRQIIYPDEINREAEERLKNTRYTQSALFVTEYALAKLWMNWGIKPSVFCGHSIGEFVAAHLAGVFALADVLKLIAIRGQLVSELPRGSMLSVRIEADKIGALMPEPLSIAAINSHKLCVVAGHDEDIAAFASVLDDKGIANRVLLTSHAFHSAMMDPVVPELQKVIECVPLNRPQKPIMSTVSGDWLTDAQATDPAYWAKHLRLTVRFAAALESIFQQEQPLLLEVGPGNATATFARQQAGSRQANILTSLDKKGQQTDYQSVLKTLGQVWLNGLEPDWAAFYTGQDRVKISLPTYSFDKKRCWVDPAKPAPATQAVSSPIAPVAAALPVDHSAETSPHAIHMRKDVLINKVKEMLEDASGIDMTGVTSDMSFLEMGLDSLLLTQVSLTLRKEFGLPITFRQLNEDYATLDNLAGYLDGNLPAEAFKQAPVPQPVNQLPSLTFTPPSTATTTMQPSSNSVLELMAQQLQILSKQVALMQGNDQTPPSITSVVPPAVTNGKVVAAQTPNLTPEEEIELKKPFGASARIERQATELSSKQAEFLQQLIHRYNKRTGGSKTYTQQHRPHMADPRVVSGFKPLTKDLIYPIVINTSKGSRLWDVDGNEYIDMLNGFGSNMFGYQPNFIKDVLHNQIENGFEVGPQHELAGEVSQLICDFTGFDRAALCSTGSEAVLGAMRVARTVTGRSLIVAFSGSYHGIVDEVIVRGTKKLKSFPAAPGIMPESVQNMLILDYGTDESLRIIKERAHELAAVLVEPVQSRRPEFVPIDFLKQVRKITAASETALIFDEVITGFRMHPGGTQALFGIKADLATYGKVIGGGLPIGVIAGHKEFMDALDGGSWQYDDASFPEKGVTYFAGTFVRHPLALAAAKASLLHLKASGPNLQKALTAKAERLTNTLNAEFGRRQLPIFVARFGSLWKIKYQEEIPYSELLFTLMREKGIHIWDGFPCFITEAHTDAEIDLVIKLFIESIQEMTEAGFFKSVPELPLKEHADQPRALNEPPTPGARMGRDREGNPAWFISDPEQPGKYLQIKI